MKVYATLDNSKILKSTQTSIIEGFFCMSEDNVVLKEIPYKIKIVLLVEPTVKLQNYQILKWGDEKSVRLDHLKYLFDSLGIEDNGVIDFLEYKE